MSDAVPVSLRRGVPLAPAQRPLWMSQRRHPDAPVQNMPLLSHLDGEIDADRLAEAFADVVAASDALRTSILDDGAGTSAVVGSDPAVTEIIDMDRADVREWAQARASVPITVRRSGYDSVVVRHEDGTASWYLNLHHTITDATSSATVFAQTAAAYDGKDVELDSYYRWAADLASAGGVRRERATDHWRARPAAPGVGRLYRAARQPDTTAERRPVALDDADWAAIEEAFTGPYRMISDDLAWSALLITAVSVHLHRVAGADRFSIGMPVHNRSDDLARGLVGTLMEVFPVDVDVASDDTFRSLHHRISRSVMETLRHAQPGTGPAADYEAVVNVILRGSPGWFGPVPASTEWIHSGAIDSAHLLRVQLMAYSGEPELALDVNHAAADHDHRRRADAHFLTIVRAMLADPDASILEASLPTADEADAIARWGAGEPRRSLEPTDVVTALREQLPSRTDLVLEDGGRRWTGRELWDDIQGVARALRARGVGPGVRVGIEIPRSADAVIAMLATSVAGGSYVPLDPTQPQARRDRLVERAGCLVRMTELLAPVDGPPITDGPSRLDEAYLLFTSGSTGEPKGVPITHHGLAGYIEFAADSYVDRNRPPVVALFTALTFDLTVTSIFVPLVTGGRTVVIGTDGPAALGTLADRTDITWAKATPSHLEVLERLLPADHQLDTLVVGGEAFGANLGRRLFAWQERTGRERPLRIFNEYGPTEAVVGCMIHETSPAELAGASEVPIGRPSPGVTLKVVDHALADVALGAPGELLIAHDGLTSGYLLADEDANATSPFVVLDGVRFYRSGDLVRMVDDTTLEYLGRIDAQVKVGGVRLEPSEVENALVAHPHIRAAAVRLWTPTPDADRQLCVRCGLSSEVPGVTFDDAGVCSSCAAYDLVAPQAESWFRNPDDLAEVLERAQAAKTGEYDCLHLLSGGKDSTYALYQLVEHGFRPYVLTLDNGYIAEGAMDNVRRSVENLGLDHEFATTDAMNEIFRDSLDRFSNVCNGCYKTIYTLAITRAVELGIPLIVTGLSRGQLFETRLIPQQFREGHFDPDAIDRAVIEARKAYHKVDDAAQRLLDTSVFDDDDLFERLEFLDFFRYVDVPLSEMLSYLDTEAPWVRPDDTGRSTNCLINVAGIHTHLTEQGYHNYAMPYAWDVRLGHKTRHEALEELDDEIDMREVDRILADVDYEPRTRPVLTAWLDVRPGEDAPSPAELRSFLADRVPGYAIPSAFVAVDELPMTTNGKLAEDELPAPTRVHRPGPSMQVQPDTELERTIVSVWERVLRIEPIGVEDDFFALGGDSLSALQMIVGVGDELGMSIREEYAFSHATPRSLAAAIEADLGEDLPGTDERPVVEAWTEPPLSDGEKAILYEQRLRDSADHTDVRYHLARAYRIHGDVDADAMERAARVVAARHVPLTWSFGTPRRPLAPDTAVSVEIGNEPISVEALDRGAAERHRRPFDLEAGPLVRLWIQPVDDGTTNVLVVMHHVSADALSFDRFWDQLVAELTGAPAPELTTDYASFTAAQRVERHGSDLDYWRSLPDEAPDAVAIARPGIAEPDGYLSRTTSITPDELRYGTGVGGFAAVVAAITAALRRRADGDTIRSGFVASTRTHTDADDLVGYFLNTLPVDLDCRPDTSLRALAAAAREAVNGHLAHRTLPYAEILNERPSGPAGNPDVLLSFVDFGELTFDGATVEHDVLFSGTAVADATFLVQPRPDRVDIGIEHRGSVFTARAADELLTDVEHMLRVLVDAPDTAVGAVDLAGEPALLDGGPIDAPETLLTRIADHAATAAAQPAVVCGDDVLTWNELDAAADRVAFGLRSRGVAAGERVIVRLPRSTDLVVAILGVLRSGAAYVPVDPSYPSDRIRLIEASADAVVSIVADPTAEDETSVAALSSAATEVLPVVTGDDVAYVMFTSGSTGTPRGVAVRHRELAASTTARDHVYPERPERFLVVSSIAFDSSVAGLYWTLATGGTVVLPTDRAAQDPSALVELVRHRDITHTLLVPTLYRAMLDQATDGPWPARIIVAGEASGSSLVAEHHRRFGRSILTNEYGPTEATVWATATDLVPDPSGVSIGGPIPGTWVAVVDPDGVVRTAGLEGELVVGGAGLTAGYVNDADATAARFVEHAGLPGRAFRTGDRVAVVDGAVRFLGRRDDQLNLGGVRAEPEDIERVLTADPAVAAAVVVAVDPRSADQLLGAAGEDDLRTALATAATADDPAAALLDELRTLVPGPMRLLAHVEAADDVDIDALRRRASAALPALMRPQRYSVHGALPRTAHGKIDRRAAATLEVRTPKAAVAAPEVDDALAAEIAAVMAAVLDGSPVAVDASFFEVGGHSLLAMELLNRIERRHGVRLDLGALYDDPTPRGIAAVVAAGSNGAGADTVRRDRFLMPIKATGSKPPLIGVHVLGANESFFRPMAAQLDDDQPLHVISVPVDHPDPALLDDIDAITRAYADTIARELPPGPVGLIGMSLGGPIAFELAKRLRAAGRDITILAMLDAAGPDGGPLKLTRFERVRVRLGQVGSVPLSQLFREARRFQRVRFNRYGERIALALYERLGRPVPIRLRRRRIVENNVAAVGRHEFLPGDQRVTVFKAMEDPFARKLLAAEMGWGRVATGGVDIVSVPGTHLSMVTEVNAGRLAAAIEAELDSGPAATADRRDDVTTTLRQALAADRLSATTRTLLERSDDLDPNDLATVRMVDGALADLAAQVSDEADRVRTALAGASVAATIAPVPNRLTRAALTVMVDPSDASTAIDALETIGYRPQFPSASSSRAEELLRRRASGSMMLIATDGVSTRIHVVWTAERSVIADRFGSVARSVYRRLRPRTPSGGDAVGFGLADLGPFLATPNAMIEPLMRFAGVTSDDLVVDLGCGDGRIAIEAARRFGCRTRGVERDPGLAALARQRVVEAGLEHRVEIVEGSVDESALADATVVFCFLPPEATASLLEESLALLPHGGRFLTHEQLDTSWPIDPDATEIVVGQGVTVARLWRA